MNKLNSTSDNKVLVALDVSSTSQKNLNIGHQLVSMLLNSKRSVVLCLFDTLVRSEIEVNLSNLKLCFSKINAASVGGTDFNSVLAHAQKNNYKNVTIISDGLASDPFKKELNLNWILTNGDQNHLSWGNKTLA